MGTTIRRQPVNHSIPASPDYKFLNITNFGGMSVSSNPFVVSSNTASDCLNVYVDEDNALSTRPRLHKKYDLLSLLSASKTFKLIGVYDLHDGYLLHGSDNGNYYMYKFEESDEGLHAPKQITGDVPKNRCVIFEQNDTVYILDGDKYKDIKNDVISDIEGYIPTTTIGRYKPAKTEDTVSGVVSVTYDKSGNPFESYNLLADKYKETYFWDGDWDINDVKLSPEDVIENGYLTHDTKRLKDAPDWVKQDVRFLQFLTDASATSEDRNYYLARSTNGWIGLSDHVFLIVATDKEMSLKMDEAVILPFRTDYFLDEYTVKGSSDGSTFIVVPNENATNPDGIAYVYTRGSITSSAFTEHTINLTGESSEVTNIHALGVDVSTNGKIILVKSDVSLATNHNGASVLIYDADADEYNCYLMEAFTANSTMDAGGSVAVGVIQDEVPTLKTNAIRRYVLTESFLDKYKDLTLPIDIETETVGELVSLQLSPSGTSLIVGAMIRNLDGTEIKGNKLWYYPTLASEPVEIEFTTNRDWMDAIFLFDPSETIVYWKSPLRDNGGLINLTSKKVIRDIPLDALSMLNPYVLTNGIGAVEPDSLSIHTDSLLLDSTEPLLVVTRNINTLEKENKDLIDKRRALLHGARLCKRFDNNTWFASGNHTFHTQYNDPTYIPLISYNDLGEDYEDITGLSIVNDDILAAYKRNRIYIITPTTIADQYTYVYTETKNVVGNDVIGAPILTILTEMPIQVSYDGIYALNQLENVQSSDRITTLISENINPRWLTESKSDIDESQTLNRLYWTYFILPHKKTSSDDKNHTRVYLLDNRTQSWFYWELPILNLDSMVKYNKTHFVDVKGVVYTLETSDLLNEYNPDVTEYYDKVGDEKVIIPWHWYSQILSLNTINYSKKLIDTTFILTDTDTTDEYALDYSFIAYRKSVSATNATTISNKINYVQSTTKRTMIPRFNFVQLRLNNTEDDLDNNKLRLVGLGLKYVLLEGLY